MVASDERKAWPVRCDNHPESSAIAICTECGTFNCKSCRSVTIEGLALCPNCWSKQHHGDKAKEERASALQRLTRSLRTAFLNPARYARNLRLGGRMLPSLNFGVVCVVIGQLAFFMWVVLLMRETYNEQVATIATELDVSTRQYQILRFALLPIDALVRIGLYGLLLQLGAVMTGTKRAFRYRDYVQLICFSAVAYLFLLVPLIAGVLLTLGYALTICWYAVKHHHRLTSSQAFVAIIPLSIGMFIIEMMGGF